MRSSNPEAFKSALSKGLGRTILTLQTEDPAPYREAILEACLAWPEHRLWMEAEPAPYLMEHVRLAKMEEQVLDAVLKSLPEEHPEHIHYHLLWILIEYVKSGKESAWDAMTSRANDGDRVAQRALAKIHPKGLIWLTQNIISGIPEENSHEIVTWASEIPKDDLSEELNPLKEAAEKIEAGWEKSRSHDPSPASFEPGLFLELPAERMTLSMALQFARQASPAQLQAAAQKFIESENPTLIKRLAKVFQRTAFPLEPELLIQRADDPEHGWAFRTAMGLVDSPAIRSYALALLVQRPLPWHAIWAIESSFRPGDEPLILEALQTIEAEDEDDVHHHIKCVRDLLERQEEIDWEPFYRWIYEHSPCSTCRAGIVRWAVEDGVLFEDWIEELQYDVDPDIRALVQERNS